MKRVAIALGVSRSQLNERLRRDAEETSADNCEEPRRAEPAQGGEGERSGPCTGLSTEADLKLVSQIREIVDERATYGYRRVTALLKREGTRVNHKRVYRVMKQAELLLQRCTGNRPGRLHEGRVATLLPNLRWCTDTFVIRAWDGQRIEVAFCLDCCDREVISWVAAIGYLDAEHVRDMMLTAAEARFGARVRELPHAIEWLSDNGGVFTADDTVAFGERLGFVMCTTPPYSPQSNGMAESFVKSFKRDYVYVNKLGTAEQVLQQLAAWFLDYNTIRPHKALRMLSPAEYRKLAS